MKSDFSPGPVYPSNITGFPKPISQPVLVPVFSIIIIIQKLRLPRDSVFCSCVSSFVSPGSILVCVNLCPPGFAKRHAKLSSLLSCLPPCLPAPKASRVVDTHVPFSKLFPPSFLTPALVGHWCPPELTTADISALHSHSFPILATVHYVQLPKQVHRASGHLWGVLLLTWQSTSI